MRQKIDDFSRLFSIATLKIMDKNPTDEVIVWEFTSPLRNRSGEYIKILVDESFDGKQYILSDGGAALKCRQRRFPNSSKKQAEKIMSQFGLIDLDNGEMVLKTRRHLLGNALLNMSQAILAVEEWGSTDL